MAEDFLARFARRYHHQGLRLAPAALRALEVYHWPGNVRELSHVIERAVLLAGGDRIDTVEVGTGATPPAPPTTGAVLASGMTLDQAEQALIRNALDRCQGNIQRTADALGLSRGALYRRLEKYGLAAAE